MGGVEQSVLPLVRTLAEIAPPAARTAGICRGLNTAAGSDDDGWEVTPPVRLQDGTSVRLLKDGEALHVLYDALAAAKESIFLESYIFAGDETGRAFMEQLVRKARDGVRVYVLYDSFGSFETPRKLFREMKESGVNVEEFHPVRPWHCNYSWRPFNRDHRKLVVVDGRMAGLGGLNVANEYGGSWITHNHANMWRDCGIAMEGPSVASLAATFIHNWVYVRRGGRVAKALFRHNLSGQEGPVGVLGSVPSMDSAMSELLGQLLRDARQSIDLTSAYFAPTEFLVQQLIAAARRGVQVRLMLPSRTDVRIMLTAARSFYAQLMGHGIEVYERQHVKLHAKTLVIDGAVSVLGSTNFDHRSIDYNCELAVVIRSGLFGEQMVRLFEHDIAHARQMNAGEWRHRPWADRFVQWAVNRSRYLL